MVHTCKPNTQEAEIGELPQVPAHPEVHISAKRLSQKTKAFRISLKVSSNNRYENDIKHIYAIKFFLLLLYLICLLMANKTRDSKHLVSILHLIDTHPNGQPLSWYP